MLLVLLTGGLALAGPTVTVGNPATPDTLPQEIQDAHTQGADRIVIRSGTYRFSIQNRPLLLINSWKNVHISGHGVTLVSGESRSGSDLIEMVDCSGVEIGDLTLSQYEPIAYQGKVSKVEQTSAGVTCVWRPDKGYPAPAMPNGHFDGGPNVVDAQTRTLKIGCGEARDAEVVESLNEGYRVKFPRPINLAAGDWLVAPRGSSPSKVHLVNCHDCTLSNLILMRNGPDAVKEELGGGNSYYDCHLQTGLKPDGAIEKPLVACSGRGFSSIGAYPGPDIENCDFTGISLDDCISVHGSYQTVKQVNGPTIVVSSAQGGYLVGQPIRISSPGFIANAFIQIVLKNPDGSYSLTLDKALPVPVGAKVSNPLKNGQSFKILNCHLGNTRSRAVTVMGDSGFVENDLIENCGQSAVVAGPDAAQNEADYVRDLAVKSNQFKNNGFSGGDNPAVLVRGDGVIGNKNVDVEGNSFDSDLGGEISLNWTNIVTIKNNSFVSPLKRPEGLDRPTLLSLAHCSAIRILDNLVKNELLYYKPWIQVKDDVTGLDQQNGRGLRN